MGGQVHRCKCADPLRVSSFCPFFSSPSCGCYGWTHIGGAGDTKKEGKESAELEKYWQVVRNNPADFTGWTYLLQYVEQENNLAAAREAFDKFFSYYPYCYGYWKKYADMEKKLCSIEKAEETFERGVAAIPLSVDLWIHYINFVKSHFKDEENYYTKVKNLFERAIESSGQDFRSDRLWDMFVTWELENKNLKEVTAIYERVLQVPTQLYGHHFEKFQEHVKTHLPKDILSTDEFLQLRQQYMESMRKATPVGPPGQSGDEAGTAQMEIDEDDGDAPPPGVDDAPPPGVEDATKEDTKALKNDNEAKYIRDKVVEKRRELFKANEAEVGRRWAFEEGIKRPYFHVKPLERLQLKNWREYLDFETQNGNHPRTVILYERCLIACALYEDMWMKYIKYLDTAEPEKVNDVFRRACTTHLVRKPSISLAWATYEEKHGRFEEASAILAEMESRIPDLLEPTLRRINVERRRGCPEKVEELYRKCISQAETASLKSHFAGKLARFLCKVQNKLENAKEVLKEALDREPTNTRLYMQLADLGYQQCPPDEALVLEAFDLAIGNTQLPAADKLVFLQRKLEFLEDFGSDVTKVQEAFDEYSKLAKAQELAQKKRPAEEPQETPEKKPKTAELNGADAAAASAAQAIAAATSSAAAADATAQYNYAQQWAGYPQAYNYQQAWNAYPASSYYPTH
ncbi:pre-mRNA processing factor 39 isoform X1 [Dermacentor variabilis]|uniref:pre-mRNA processing factor 39 isoform X1 n=2 Tax=Dermacentor variabilis TaxID=34621 RepID=UPI003F5BA3C4